MNWPNATDYNAAVQNPRLCFRDDELRQGQAVGDLFGLPRPHSGNFADVYQIQGADGQSWAVKCFTRPAAGLQPRYQAITEHLRQTQRAFMVDFRYLEEGICIHGRWYPLVKMRWVEGFRLNEFVREQLDKPVVLERLGQLWRRLAGELREARMAHGDLQHGNVLMVPSNKGSSLALKLIDYDGMYVPALADRPSEEVGHPNYQHPQRLREGGYHAEMDRFAHLLICTALRCLRVGGLDLWQRYDNLENLLFREDDFRQPGQSALLRELWDIKDRDTHYLLGHLLLAAQGPLVVVPSLDEVADDSGVRPLSEGEEARIDGLLNVSSTQPRRAQARSNAAANSLRQQEAAQSTAILADAATIESDALADTASVVLKPRSGVAPLPQPSVSSRSVAPPPLPPRSASSSAVSSSLDDFESHPQRRTSAEIDLDTQPPAQTRRKLDASRFVDAAVAVLSRPGWLAVLGMLALVSFLAVNVLVWSSVKPPTPHTQTPPPPTVTDIGGVPVKASDEKHISHPVLEPSTHRVCVRGRSTTLRFGVRRNNCREPLTLRLQGLPADVRQESAASADGDKLSVTLTVADKQRPGSLAVDVRLLRGDTVADSKPMLLTIAEEKPAPPVAQRKPPPARLSDKSPRSLTVEAGKSAELLVVLDRGDNRSAIEVSLVDLPAGATAAPIVVAGAISFKKLTVAAAKDMSPDVYSVKLRLRGGGQILEESDVSLRVTRPRGLQETVSFSSVDRVRLAATLYHGWKGKKGMTVLMLHDLGLHDRGSPGWKRLAETLQAEGHTVLTFDFRGHGDSKEVTKDFWNYPVNRWLLTDYMGHPLDRRSGRLDGRILPGDYLPWLIEDIAAAQTYLDIRHDDKDGPVNTFNMVLVAARRASALGSLWLATEGVRCNAADVNKKTVLKPPEKNSFLYAAWIGMDNRLNGRVFPVGDWIGWARLKPPPGQTYLTQTYAYGDGDDVSERLLRVPDEERRVVPNAKLCGQRLLDEDDEAARWIGKYLVAALKSLPPQTWVPRKIKTLHSYWAVPVKEPDSGRVVLHCFTAKSPGEAMLRPVPLERFGVAIKGLEPRASFRQGVPNP